MKQSKSSKLTKQTTAANYQEGTKGEIDIGLPALVASLCSNRPKCSGRNRMPCKQCFASRINCQGSKLLTLYLIISFTEE